MSDDLKVIIAGGRDFTSYDILLDFVHATLVPQYELHDIEFISGHANGADQLGEHYAEEHWGAEPTIFKPDYVNDPPKLAPLRRNRKMAEYAHGGVLIAFLSLETAPSERGSGQWSAHGGTWNMINNAIAHEMEIHICRY